MWSPRSTHRPADRPRIEHQHVERAIDWRRAGDPATGAGRSEPSHQVIVLDHQVLDEHVRIGLRGQPDRESLATGFQAAGQYARSMHDHPPRPDRCIEVSANGIWETLDRHRAGRPGQPPGEQPLHRLFADGPLEREQASSIQAGR
jgi:hypothetical protein